MGEREMLGSDDQSRRKSRARRWIRDAYWQGIGVSMNGQGMRQDISLGSKESEVKKGSVMIEGTYPGFSIHVVTYSRPIQLLG